MLSRVADAIYWMGRYVERAENIARCLDVTLSLMLDTPFEAHGDQWQALISTTGDREEFFKSYDTPDPASVVRFTSLDRAHPNSIVSCLANARENARSVREVISREQWESLNRFYRMIDGAQLDPQDIAGLSGFYASVRQQAALFQGLSDSVWSHDEGWHFMRLGTAIERADQTSRILDVKYFLLLPTNSHINSAYDLVQWSALLSSASAAQMYRQRYHVTSPRHVCEFLIFDNAFPRSIRHCIDRANSALHAISGNPIGYGGYESERLLGRLRSHLAYGTVDDVFGRGLHEYIDDVQGALIRVSASIAEDFFSGRSRSGVNS
ncbi:MAG: alpha-E domain-containing protein [Planctomycetota bacterium]|nr:MAG: alpha-E domain-containing protein [Planctomycetota bacterium]